MNEEIKFAINENTLFQCDLIDYIDACKKAGFNAVEISYLKLKDALKFISKKNLMKVFKGLEIVSLNAFEDTFLVPDSGLKALEAEAALIGELCTLAECPVVVVPSGRWYQKYGILPSEDEIIRLYRSRLEIIKAVLDKYNIEIMFEPIAYPEFIVGEPGMINAVLDGPDFKNIRIVPDIHNLHYNGLGSEQLKDINAEIGIFHIDGYFTDSLNRICMKENTPFSGNFSHLLNRVDNTGFVVCPHH